jgi:putative component of membrane protein insertase Oxa1/YidC/SpoIIIJ protein YidD
VKYLLIFIILIYQAIIPRRFRGVCLFKESCSNFVCRKAKNGGFKGGIKALFFRINGQIHLLTSTYIVVEEKDIDERILMEHKQSVGLNTING